MTRNHLLDASALLALIRNEPGRDRVRAVLDDSQIHSVNLAEVARKMVSKGMPAAEVESLLDELRLDVVEELSNAKAAVGNRRAGFHPAPHRRLCTVKSYAEFRLEVLGYQSRPSQRRPARQSRGAPMFGVGVKAT